MKISLRELKKDYFKFLPCIVSSKEDSEPLQHAVFTYGDLREVMASFQRAQYIRDQKAAQGKP